MKRSEQQLVAIRNNCYMLLKFFSECLSAATTFLIMEMSLQ